MRLGYREDWNLRIKSLCLGHEKDKSSPGQQARTSRCSVLDCNVLLLAEPVSQVTIRHSLTKLDRSVIMFEHRQNKATVQMSPTIPHPQLTPVTAVSTNRSFSLAAFILWSIKKLRCRIMELVLLPDSTQSRAKPCFPETQIHMLL